MGWLDDGRRGFGRCPTHRTYGVPGGSRCSSPIPRYLAWRLLRESFRLADLIVPQP